MALRTNLCVCMCLYKKVEGPSGKEAVFSREIILMVLRPWTENRSEITLANLEMTDQIPFGVKVAGMAFHRSSSTYSRQMKNFFLVIQVFVLFFFFFPLEGVANERKLQASGTWTLPNRHSNVLGRDKVIRLYVVYYNLNIGCRPTVWLSEVHHKLMMRGDFLASDFGISHF